MNEIFRQTGRGIALAACIQSESKSRSRGVGQIKTNLSANSILSLVEVTILVNDAEKASDIDPQEAQQTLEIVEANLRKVQGKRQTIEANLALRQART
ncbi:ATP synthase epsilon chain [Cucumis melo var. makuwa]|nr:ATP synthase epsilon chain [Cucumis melo var. makuwa]TYK06179.1 ATP synthase epsilon chain [Cucumis melo var. makuwa]